MVGTLGPMHAGVTELFENAIAALTAAVRAWREQLDIIVTYSSTIRRGNWGNEKQNKRGGSK